MTGWGVFLVIMGAGSVLLPRIGFGFLLMQPLDAYQPYAGAVVSLVGVVLVIAGMTRRREAGAGEASDAG